MRKITTFLTLCLLSWVGAVAQTTITALTQVNANKAYTITTAARGAVMANAEGTALRGTEVAPTVAKDPTDTKQQFAFVKSPHTGGFFLYSVSAKKFINLTTTLEANPTAPVQLNAWGDGTVQPYWSATKRLNMNGVKNATIDSWSTKDGGNQFTITEVADFDPTEALAIFNQQIQVTYNVVASGATVATKTVTQDKNSTAVLPEELKRGYCVYQLDKTQVGEENTTVNATYTFTSPVTLSESFATAHWLWLRFSTRNPWEDAGAQVNFNAKSNSDAQAWAIVGNNPYEGFKIYNKAAGESKTLQWSNLTADNNAQVVKDGDTANSLYELYPSQKGGFTLKLKGSANNYLNDRGKLSTWNNTGATNDDGSNIVASEFGNLFADYVANIKPYLNSATVGKYFGLTVEASSALGSDPRLEAAEASQQMNATDYAALLAIRDAGIKKPAAGALINLKSVLAGTGNYAYLGYGKTQKKLRGDVQNTEIGTVVTYEPHPTEQGKAALKVEGKYVNQASANTTLIDTPFYFIVNIITPSVVGFRSAANDAYSYLHVNGSMNIVNWEAAANASRFLVEDAADVTVALNEVAGTTYATTFLPFNAEITGADALALAKQEGTAELAETALTGVIAANTPMLLRGTGATATVRPTTAAATTLNPANNCLVGQMLAATTNVAATDFVLGKFDGVAGFYHYSGTLGANKAYITGSASNARGFVIPGQGTTTGIANVAKTNAETAIYDLQGRKVTKAQNGLYIVNGKKVLVK